MERSGVDWILVLLLLIPFITLAIIFFRSKERIIKIECVMAEIVCLLGLLSYSLPKTSPVGSPIETAGLSIAFGIIAAMALLIIGLIEIKKFEIKSK